MAQSYHRRKRSTAPNRERPSRSRRGRKSPNQYKFLAIGFSLLFLVLLLWGGFKLGNYLFSFAKEEKVESFAELDVISSASQGAVQVQYKSLEEGDTKEQPWVAIEQDDRKIRSNEPVKTGTQTIASLDVFDPKNRIYIGSFAEFVFEDIYKIEENWFSTIKLNEGEIWADISKSDFGDDLKDSVFLIKTDGAEYQAKGGIFDLYTSSGKDELRVLEGLVEVTLLDENGAVFVQGVVGQNQKLDLDEDNINSLKQGLVFEDVLDVVDNNFLFNEDWHLRNLQKHDPEEFAKLKRLKDLEKEAEQEKADALITSQQTEETTEEGTSEDSTEEVTTEKAPALTAPQITDPSNGVTISNQALIKVTGVVPAETYKVRAENEKGGAYDLDQFKVGNQKFNYYFSEEIGNLKAGENTIKFYAINKDGVLSAPGVLTFTYEGEIKEEPTPVPEETPPVEVTPTPVTPTEEVSTPVTPEIPTNGAIQMVGPEFLANTPAGSPAETSSDVVNMVGAVPNGTEKVIVNDSTLQQFKSGDSQFSYRASVDGGGLQEGQNIYLIKAIDSDGNATVLSVTIVYKPAVE